MKQTAIAFDQLLNALFAAIEVTEQEPFTAMARLGVQIVQVAE